jgi:hypothetical protein
MGTWRHFDGLETNQRMHSWTTAHRAKLARFIAAAWSRGLFSILLVIAPLGEARTYSHVCIGDAPTASRTNCLPIQSALRARHTEPPLFEDWLVDDAQDRDCVMDQRDEGAEQGLACSKNRLDHCLPTSFSDSIILQGASKT